MIQINFWNSSSIGRLACCAQPFGHIYFNTSVAYAVGLAIHLKVKEIGLYGCDFTYPDTHVAESGRACVEFLLGIAGANGAKRVIAGGWTRVDGGPVVAQSEVPVRAGDDEISLSARVQAMEHKLYPMVIGWFARGALRCRHEAVMIAGKRLGNPRASPFTEPAKRLKTN